MPAAKRARAAMRPEDVKVGTMVLYHDGQQGVVCDAFAALDQFWVRSLATGEKVKNDDGDIIAFSADDLRPAVTDTEQALPSVRVLLVGTEPQILRILTHFGRPELTERRDPQMYLAVPCSHCMCGPSCKRFDPRLPQTCDQETCPVLQLATGEGGVDRGMLELAESLRPDLKGGIQTRPYHLKQAIEQLGPDMLKLQGYYALSGVSMPYGIHDIEAADVDDRPLMEDVRCHIDIGVTAEGRSLSSEASMDNTAKRVLAEACGVSISDVFWTDEVQFKLRKMMNVDLPIKYWDGPEVKGYIIMLPADLIAVVEDSGLLAFRQPQGVAPALPQAAQDLSRGPRLPANWVRMESRSSGQVYYWNNKTQESTFELPLPPGWTKHTSKSTGKVYYFHAQKQISVYDPPTEP